MPGEPTEPVPPRASGTDIEPHVIVLFGATGDLARRKLIPGLLHLCEAELMPDFRLVGSSRKDIGDDAFRELARDSIRRVRLGRSRPRGHRPIRRQTQPRRHHEGP